MNIKDLFKHYKETITDNPYVETIFANSGIVNVYGKLDFGFFPLGSGILTNKSEIEQAAINVCNILVLGNDFGTQDYLLKKCPNNREKITNSTIRNLIHPNGLGLDVESTFFTNLHLGLRINGTNIKRTIKINDAYKKVCFNFLKVQLDFFNPKIVICLGKEVTQSLLELSDDFSTTNNIFSTADNFLGNRKFILIPHPSMAHFNWTAALREKIKTEIKLGNII